MLTTLLDVRLSRSTLKKEIEEHPDYPSLLSVGDVLASHGIENLAAKFDTDKLDAIPVPFITLLKSEKYRTEFFTVVKAIHGDSIVFFDPEKHRWTKDSREDFVKRCSGIVLLAEAGENAGEKDFFQKRREEKRLAFSRYLAACCIPALVLAAGLFSFLHSGMAALLPFLFTLLTLAGSLTGVLLLWYELDQYNPMLQQICSAGRKANCSAVLHSKGARIFGIPWSVIGFTYFAGSLACLLVSGISNPVTLWLLSWLNLAACGYIAYSLYYQWRVARQWCVLCLTVQAILALQCIVAFTAGWHGLFPAPSLSAGLLLQVLAAFAIPFIAVTLLMPALRKAKESRQSKTELQRLKHNPQIFEALLARQKAVTESTEGLGITLGNPQAAHKIIKVCNPYCGPCATAHPLIDELLDSNPDIQLQIIFTASNQENDLKAPPVKHLLAIAEQQDESATRQALDDWYLAPKKDYEAFAMKYPMNGELKRQEEKLQAMHEWCNKTEIMFTPTFFVNGHQLPNNYSVADLKYFLSA